MEKVIKEYRILENNPPQGERAKEAMKAVLEKALKDDRAETIKTFQRRLSKRDRETIAKLDELLKHYN